MIAGLTATLKNGGDIPAHLLAAATRAERGLVQLVTSYALRIEREAKLQAPVRANVLHGSIHTVLETGPNRVSARVGTGVIYGPAQNYGSGLYGPKASKYPILPKNKKALAWASPVGWVGRGEDMHLGGLPGFGKQAVYHRGGGKLTKVRSMAQKDRVVRKVMHPGVRGTHFLTGPFEQRLPEFRADATQLLWAIAQGK